MDPWEKLVEQLANDEDNKVNTKPKKLNA